MCIENPIDEEKLLLQLRQGDQLAFQKIYDTHHYNITGHLMRMLKSTELVKEVVQDTFMALWEYRDRIDPKQSIKPYLFRIASNHAFNVFKKAAHDQKYRAYLIPIIEEGYEHIESNMLRKENEQLLQNLLQNLPDKQREVYVRCKLQGERYEEVATNLGISVHTVHTHIKRANQYFKDHLAKNPELLATLLLSFFML